MYHDRIILKMLRVIKL